MKMIMKMIVKILTLIKFLKCVITIIHLSIYLTNVLNLTYLISFQRVEHFKQRSIRETFKIV